MIYRHFFWDFDGTLFDSYACIVRAARMALSDIGVQAGEDEIMPLAKRSLDAVFRYYAPKWDAGEMIARYRVHAHDLGVDGIRLYPGAKEMLETVCLRGGRNYLYTHRHALSADECLRRDGAGGLFADAVTADDGFPPKPAPDALCSLVRKHGLDAKDCVMIGDRDIDLDAGKNAGMKACLFDPEGFYPDYDADHRFRDYAAMMAALT